MKRIYNIKGVNWMKVVTHLLVLLIIFVGPEMLFSMGHEVPKLMYLGPLAYICAFYVNYYYLIDKFFFAKKNQWAFYVINFAIVVLTIALVYYLHSIIRASFSHAFMPMNRPNGFMVPPINPIMELLREVPKGGLPVVLAISICVMMKENERKSKWEDLEKQVRLERQENELKNLKNQLNPHFLFNTLNNIYSLIPLSQQKAQLAIHDLSQLLRYVLYENNTREVMLMKDLKFVKNYIALMRLRFTDNVKINVRINENVDAKYHIAPLMFISLIENAFKHGVSVSNESFVDVEIRVEEDKVKCKVSNSYYPKDNSDKSGSGIGIANLQKQLSILYPDSHKYTIECEKNVYTAYLEIGLTIL